MASSSGPSPGPGEAKPATDRAARPREPGGENASLRAAVVFGVLLAVAAVLALYALVAVWPPAPAPALTGGTAATTGGTAATTSGTPATTTQTTATTGGTTTTTGTTIVVQGAPNPPVSIFGWTLHLDREARLFWVVALAGALGGFVYSLRSLSWYTGNRNLKYSWLLTYPLQPVVGAALATITYVVVRGGLVVVTTQASPDVANPFGFAAFGALVGLFSAEAAEWLKRIFGQVFAPAPKGKDPAIELGITDFEPKQGPVGTPVTITGSGFSDVQAVMFNKVAVAPTDLSRVSDTELRVRVPEGATDGLITVTTTAGPSVDSSEPFKLVPPGGNEAPPQGAGASSGRARGRRFRRRGPG
jgi:IPT/TIG domain